MKLNPITTWNQGSLMPGYCKSNSLCGTTGQTPLSFPKKINGCFQILQQAMCGDNERNDLVLMMNGRHPPIQYCPLTLNFKVVLKICKKLNLRSKNEVPARKKKKLILYRVRQMDISNEREHLLITYHMPHLAVSPIYEERVPYIIVPRAGKNVDRTGYI